MVKCVETNRDILNDPNLNTLAADTLEKEEKKGMKKKTYWILAIMLVLGLSLAGCARDKEPAAAAIKAAEDAFNAAKAEATKYVPDQIKAVEGSIKAAKDNFDKGEYTAALNAAKDIPAKVKELSAAAAAKKAELTKSWEAMSAELPKIMEAAKGRLEALGKVKKLPAGIDKAKLDSAKSGLDGVNQAWTDAENTFKAGNLKDALAKGKAAKDKASEILATLPEVPQPPAKPAPAAKKS